MLITSVKPTADLSLFPVRYWPSRVTFEHYAVLLQRTSFAGNLMNSAIIACGACWSGS